MSGQGTSYCLENQMVKTNIGDSLDSLLDFRLYNHLFNRNKNELNEEEFFGFLTFKFKEDQRGARKKMRDIQGLVC